MNPATDSVLEAGTGDPIIFVHDVVTTSNIFPKYLNAYSPDFRGIAVDLRGYGDSQKPDNGFTITQFSKDLIALTDKLGIEKPIWVGVSITRYQPLLDHIPTWNGTGAPRSSDEHGSSQRTWTNQRNHRPDACRGRGQR